MGILSLVNFTVLNTLAGSDKPLTPLETSRIIGNSIPEVNDNSVRQAMRRMAISGEVELLYRGLYVISQRGRDALLEFNNRRVSA